MKPTNQPDGNTYLSACPTGQPLPQSPPQPAGACRPGCRLRSLYLSHRWPPPAHQRGRSCQPQAHLCPAPHALRAVCRAGAGALRRSRARLCALPEPAPRRAGPEHPPAPPAAARPMRNPARCRQARPQRFLFRARLWARGAGGAEGVFCEGGV